MTISKPYLLLFSFLATASARLCAAVFLSLMVLVTGANAQTVTITPGSEQELNAGGYLTLHAEVNPANAGPYIYEWTIRNRPVGVSSSGETTQDFTITVANNVQIAGDLQITLQVTGPSRDTPLFTNAPVVAVNPAQAPNRAPIATVVRLEDQTPSLLITEGVITGVDGGVTITLDGSGSSDPDGDNPLTYRWTHLSGLGVTLSGMNQATASFTTPARKQWLSLAIGGTLCHLLRIHQNATCKKSCRRRGGQ